MPPRPHTLQVVAAERLLPDILHLSLARPDAFAYRAGEFIAVQLPQSFIEAHRHLPALAAHPAGRPLLRQYSLASGPHEEHLRMLVRTLPDGAGSTYLSSLAVGDSLTGVAPLGAFVDSGSARKRVYVATGTGLAPMPALWHAGRAAGASAATLLWGLRGAHELFWAEELREAFGPGNVHLCYSQTPAEGAYHGRVTALLPQHIDTEAEYYMCGSGAMIVDVRAQLQAAGVPREQVFFEKFSA